MKWILIALLFLAACAQTQQAVYAPTTPVTFAQCESTRSVGEGCTQTCECLRPGECLKGICVLNKLELGQPCVQHSQCLSGYCTESGACGGPDGPSNFDCEKVCRDSYDAMRKDCYTVCKYR